jgi:hypothetical protein
MDKQKIQLTPYLSGPPNLVFIRRGKRLFKISGREAFRLGINIAAIFLLDGRSIGCTHRTLGSAEKAAKLNWHWVLIPREGEDPGRFDYHEWEKYRGSDFGTDVIDGDDVIDARSNKD